MKTKSTISTVCKSWREASLPFLFEIVIWSVRNNQNLLAVSSSAELSKHLCRHVRRLELESVHCNPSILVAIIRGSPQLTIYKQINKYDNITRHKRVGSEAIVAALLEHCGTSLHHLHLQGFNLPATFPELLSSHGQSLQILSCIDAYHVSTPSLGAEVSLPQLHTLAIDVMVAQKINTVPSVLEKGIYPSLQCFSPRSSSLSPSIDFSSFIQRAQVLIALAWRHDRMHRLVPHFTGLETLVIPVIGTSLNQIGFYDLQNARLRELGIVCMAGCGLDGDGEPWPDDQLEETITFFENRQLFPLITHIRVLGSVVGVSPSSWKRWVLRSHERGILLD